MKSIAAMLVVLILAVALLVGCDGETDSTPSGPIILFVVTATPDGAGPTPVPGHSPTVDPSRPMPSVTPG